MFNLSSVAFSWKHACHHLQCRQKQMLSLKIWGNNWCHWWRIITTRQQVSFTHQVAPIDHAVHVSDLMVAVISGCCTTEPVRKERNFLSFQISSGERRKSWQVRRLFGWLLLLLSDFPCSGWVLVYKNLLLFCVHVTQIKWLVSASFLFKLSIMHKLRLS